MGTRLQEGGEGAFSRSHSYPSSHISGIEGLDLVGLIFWELYRCFNILFFYSCVVITVMIFPSTCVLSQLEIDLPTTLCLWCVSEIESGLPAILRLNCVIWVHCLTRMWLILSRFYAAEPCSSITLWWSSLHFCDMNVFVLSSHVSCIRFFNFIVALYHITLVTL